MPSTVAEGRENSHRLQPLALISGMSNLGRLKDGMEGLAAGLGAAGTGVGLAAAGAALGASSSGLGVSLGLELVILP